MARHILEIYNEMILEKETFSNLNELQPNIDSGQTLLADLTTTSKVAIWRLIFFVVAFGIWSLEKLFDIHKSEIEQRATEIIPGTPSWYHRISLEYQHGDSLVFVNDQYKYNPIVPANRIVQLCSVTEIGGETLIKVAKLDAGSTVALTVSELNGFREYIKKMKFAGFQILPVSRDADLLKIHYRVYYNPLVLNPDGSLISNPSVFPVNQAINSYCVGLPFDGIFSVTALTDLIQQSAGVINPVFESAEAKYGTNPYVAIQDYYNPNAGYLKIDPLFDLDTTITYILP